MAADYVNYGKASASRPDLHGRPGVNPLTIGAERSVTFLPLKAVHRVWERCRRLLRAPSLGRFAGMQLTVSWGREVALREASANLQSISEAASKAGIVVVSVHAHRQGKWLSNFAHQTIERGASVVFVHGPHQVRGIELYGGKPILYSLGDFVYETECIERLPADIYEQRGLPADASLQDLRARRPDVITRLLEDRRTFEGVVGLVSFADGKLRSIQLVPVDLQFDGGRDRRGRPQLACPALGERIIAEVQAKSLKFGTRVTYDRDANRGEVVL
jgi:hypothetical protein